MKIEKLFSLNDPIQRENPYKYFGPKLFRPKAYPAQTFSNRAYPATDVSSELLRACLQINIIIVTEYPQIMFVKLGEVKDRLE